MNTESTKTQPPPQVDEAVNLELVDDQQILEELQGRHYEDDKYLYKVHGGFQLTYRAVKLACRMFEERGEVLEVVGDVFTKYDEKDPEYLIAHVKVQRVKITQKGQRIVMGSEVGTKRKWIKEQLTSGEVRPDKSFYEKACAQAQRNAKMALLPQDFLLDFKDMLLKKGAQRGGQASRPAQQQRPQSGKPQQSTPKETAKPQGSPQQEPAKPEGAPKPPSGTAGQAPADPKKRALTMQQQFWAVFKSAIHQAKTEAQQRNTLKRLTGKTHVRELDEKTIKTLGAALRKVAEGESAIKDLEGSDGKKALVIYHAPSSSFHWPENWKPKSDPAPATQQAAPAAEDPEAPPPDGEEQMF